MESWRVRLQEAEAEASFISRVTDRGATAHEPTVLAVGMTAWPGPDRPPAKAVVVGNSWPEILIVARQWERLRVTTGPEWPNRAAAFELIEALKREMCRVLEIPVSSMTVIGLPRPVESVAAGESAFAGGGPATFGSRVTTAHGTRAILTAGHAAPRLGAAAYDQSRSLVGTVTHSVRCASVSPRVATADVATIELDPQVQETGGGVPLQTIAGQALLWDTLTAYGAQTTGKQAAVLMTGAPFAGPTAAGGDFGEATLTAYAISAPGDSGAPAYNQRNEVVGHVVAGNQGVYSVIQDTTYQLAACGATLR